MLTKRVYEPQIDIMQKLDIAPIEIIQNDTGSCEINITLTIKGTPMDLTNCTATIKMLLQGITAPIIDGVTIVDAMAGKIKYTPNLSASGIVTAVLEVYGTENYRITSQEFAFTVRAELGTGDGIVAETNYPVLTTLISTVVENTKTVSDNTQILTKNTFDVNVLWSKMSTDVKMHGAKGNANFYNIADGKYYEDEYFTIEAANDSEYLQSFFDEVKNYEEIQFSKGTYLVDGLELIQKVGVHIHGNGSTILLKPNTNAPVLLNDGSYLCSMSGLTFHGNKDLQTQIIADADDKRDGVMWKWAFFSTFKNCRVIYNKHDGLLLDTYFDIYNEFRNDDECHLVDNFIQYNGRDGLRIDGVSDLNIHGNNVEFNGRLGCWMGMTHDVGSCNNTITNNNFISNDGVGLDIESCSRITVGNNQIRNNGDRGMNFIGGRQGTITGNNIHMNGRLITYSAGLTVAYNSDVVISGGNIITNSDFTKTQGYGIEAYDVHGLRIKDNIIKENLNEGVNIGSDCTDVKVIDNIGVVDEVVA